MASVTLDDLTLEMMELNQTAVGIDKRITMSNDYLNDINANSWANFEQLHIIADILQNNKVTALEDARENRQLQEKVLEALQGINQNTKENAKAKDLDINITKLGTLSELFIGAIVGYFKQFKAALKAIWLVTSHVAERSVKIIRGVFTTITDSIMGSKWLGHFKDLFGAVRGKVISFVAGISMQFDLLVDSMKGGKIGKALTWVKNAWEFIGKEISHVGDMFSKVWKWTAPLREAATSFGKFMLRVANVFFDVDDLLKDGKAIMSFFGDKIKGVFSKITGFFGAGEASLLGKFGRFLGKLGWFMTIWDVLSGMWEGFQKDGIMGAIIGGVKGFFKGFGELGNLLKDLVSWVSKKLGFENFSKMLDSFDMVALINNTIDSLIGWFKLLFTDPTEALSVYWNNLVGEGGLMDLLFKPINMLIDWITKNLGFREKDAPEFNLGNVFRSIWNTMLEWIASVVESVPLVGKRGADAIRGMSAGEATLDIKKMATPEKVPNKTGDTLNNAATEKRNTETVAEAVRDSAIVASSNNTAVSGGGGNTTVNSSNSSSTVNISTGSLPDRTDWSVMSGSFGLAP